MFKKNEKLPQQPKPPNLNQIIDDLETFKEEGYEFERFRYAP